MSIDNLFQENTQTDTAYCFGKLRAIFRDLETASRFVAASDLRSRVWNACQEADAVYKGWDERSKARQAKLDAEIKESLAELEGKQ